MKIVIDIDENLYTRLFDSGDIDAMDMLKAYITIRKGTPLDRIIDKIEIHRRKTEAIDKYDLVGDCLDIIKMCTKEGEKKE